MEAAIVGAQFEDKLLRCQDTDQVQAVLQLILGNMFSEGYEIRQETRSSDLFMTGKVGERDRIISLFQVVQIPGEAEPLTAFSAFKAVKAVVIVRTGTSQGVSAADQFQEVLHDRKTLLQA